MARDAREARSAAKLLLDWVKHEVQQHWAGEISLVLVMGSYVTDTMHRQSDVDIIIVPKTYKGASYAHTFIANGIGYDIFPVSWDQLHQLQDLRGHLMVALDGAELLYVDTKEDLEHYHRLQTSMRYALQDPKKSYRVANEYYADALAKLEIFNKARELERPKHELKVLQGGLMMDLANCVARIYQTFYRYGVSRIVAEMERFLPKDSLVPSFYEQLWDASVETVGVIASQWIEHLKLIYPLQKPELEVVPPWSEVPLTRYPDLTDLAGFYHEIRSTFGKLEDLLEQGSVRDAFLPAVYLQQELSQISRHYVFPIFDVFKGSEVSAEAWLGHIQALESNLKMALEEGGADYTEYPTMEAYVEARQLRYHNTSIE